MTLIKLRQKRKPNLIEGKFKTLLYVSIFGWLILLIGQVVDNVLAGNFLNEEGLAAVQILIPFSTFISALGAFTGTGFAVKFSHLKGKGDERGANQVVGLGLIFTLLLGIITSLLMFFLKEQMLSLFAMSDKVKEYASSYYDWYVGIAIVQPVFILIFKVVSQDGDPLWTVLSSVIQVAVNFVLSAILIKYIGIAGLSIGSFASISLSIVIVSIHFFTKKNSIHIRFTTNMKLLKDPLIFGFPQLVGNISIAIVNLLLNMVITKNFGDAYLASFTIIGFVSNLKLVFGCIADSMGAFLSTAKGSKNNDDINLCFKLLKKYCVIISIIMTVLIMALSLVIPMLFNVQPNSNQYVYSYMSCLIIAPVFICYAFTINLGCSYVALGKPHITLINQIVSAFVFPIIMPILFAYCFHDYYGIIAGYAVAAFFSILVMSIALAIIHKPHKVFIAPKIEEKQFSEDLYLDDEYIPATREDIINKLKQYNVEEKPLNELISIYDEACQVIRKKNPDKVVTVRLTFSISENQIKLFAKNNGRILSSEEKQEEIDNHKTEHMTLNYIYESNAINMSTMISFNYQQIIINR